MKEIGFIKNFIVLNNIYYIALTNLEYDTIFRYGLRAFPRGYVQYMVKERFLAGPTSLDSNKMVQMEEKFLKAGVLITKSCRGIYIYI